MSTTQKSTEEEEFKLVNPPAEKAKRKSRQSICASEICDILRACKDSNISSLHFGDLKLEFHKDHKDEVLKSVFPQAEVPLPREISSELPSYLEDDEDDPEVMMVRDPVLAEELLSRAMNGSGREASDQST